MSAAHATLVDSIEAAHTMDADPSRWLSTILEAVTPSIAGGFGAFAWIYDARDCGDLKFEHPVVHGVDPRILEGILEANAGASVELRRRHYLTSAAMLSASLGDAFEGHDAFHRALGPLGVRDIGIINAMDPSMRGCAFCAPHGERTRWTPEFIALLSCVAAHVATALRLLRRWQCDPSMQPELIFEADGRIAHAEGEARERDAREALAAALAAAQRARGRLRRSEPEEAISSWRALVAGRWTLVDTVERDGRRYVLAHVNPVPTSPVPSLTPREREVVHLAAIGHSNKLIAYELGISVSTVGSLLSRATRKLGCSSTRDALLQVAMPPADSSESSPDLRHDRSTVARETRP